VHTLSALQAAAIANQAGLLSNPALLQASLGPQVGFGYF
jgi:hypothetical protein